MLDNGNPRLSHKNNLIVLVMTHRYILLLDLSAVCNLKTKKCVGGLGGWTSQQKYRNAGVQSPCETSSFFFLISVVSSQLLEALVLTPKPNYCSYFIAET